MALKLRTHKKNVLNAEDKFRIDGDRDRAAGSPPLSISQLGEIAIERLNDKNLEVSKVRPFFWSLVETYVDRFQIFPFDVNKALFSHLELHDYPEEKMLELVRQLESQFERAHGRPLRKSTQLVCERDGLDDEIKVLRDSLKYAALVSEKDQG